MHYAFCGHKPNMELGPVKFDELYKDEDDPEVMKQYAISRTNNEWEDALIAWNDAENTKAVERWIPYLVATKVWVPQLGNDWLMLWAATQGHMTLLQIMLDLHPKDHFISAKILTEAIEYNQLGVVKLLSYEHHDHFKYDDMWQEALDVALFKGRTKIASFILADDRIDPTYDNNRALLHAVKGKRIESVELLLSADNRVYSNVALITVAKQQQSTEILHLLLKDLRIDPSKALVEAASNGYPENVKLLLADPRADPSINRNEAIERVASRVSNDEEDPYLIILRMLLDDPRVNPNAALLNLIDRRAVMGVDMVMSDSRIDPTINDDAALKRAATKVDDGDGLAILRLILNDPRVDVSADGDAALLTVVDMGVVDAVKMLLLDYRRGDPMSDAKWILEMAKDKKVIDFLEDFINK